MASASATAGRGRDECARRDAGRGRAVECAGGSAPRVQTSPPDSAGRACSRTCWGTKDEKPERAGRANDGDGCRARPRKRRLESDDSRGEECAGHRGGNASAGVRDAGAADSTSTDPSPRDGVFLRIRRRLRRALPNPAGAVILGPPRDGRETARAVASVRAGLVRGRREIPGDRARLTPPSAPRRRVAFLGAARAGAGPLVRTPPPAPIHARGRVLRRPRMRRDPPPRARPLGVARRGAHTRTRRRPEHPKKAHRRPRRDDARARMDPRLARARRGAPPAARDDAGPPRRGRPRPRHPQPRRRRASREGPERRALRPPRGIGGDDARNRREREERPRGILRRSVRRAVGGRDGGEDRENRQTRRARDGGVRVLPPVSRRGAGKETHRRGSLRAVSRRGAEIRHGKDQAGDGGDRVPLRRVGRRGARAVRVGGGGAARDEFDAASVRLLREAFGDDDVRRETRGRRRERPAAPRPRRRAE